MKSLFYLLCIVLSTYINLSYGQDCVYKGNVYPPGTEIENNDGCSGVYCSSQGTIFTWIADCREMETLTARQKFAIEEIKAKDQDLFHETASDQVNSRRRGQLKTEKVDKMADETVSEGSDNKRSPRKLCRLDGESKGMSKMLCKMNLLRELLEKSDIDE